MPVIWTGPGKRYPVAAYAMPCGTCGAFIGKPCTQNYSAGPVIEPHRSRIEAAEVYGFVTVTEVKELPLFAVKEIA
jgi:hypothetical protein